MYSIDTVLIKVAGRCNINCKYCYVFNMGDTNWKNMPKLIALDTVEAIGLAIKKQIDEQEKELAVVLHGGEPLLLGPDRLKHVLYTLRKYIPVSSTIAIQTNGTLITEEILDICSKYRTSLSVSLDGPQYINDRNRVGFDSESTFDKVLNGIKLLQDHWDSEFLFSGILSVIDPTSNPAEVYQFFKQLNPPSVDFLNRDGNHSQLPYMKKSFESSEYGRWLADLFDIYLSDTKPIKIRILDDLVKLILGGQNLKEGIGINDFGILVIDTDGTITKNDTLKSSYDGADRFEEKWSVFNHSISDLLKTDEYRRYHESQRPTNNICRQCDLLKVCGGGMPVHRWKNENGYDNPTVYCNDNKYLIGHIMQRLDSILEGMNV